MSAACPETAESADRDNGGDGNGRDIKRPPGPDDHADRDRGDDKMDCRDSPSTETVCSPSGTYGQHDRCANRGDRAVHAPAIGV